MLSNAVDRGRKSRQFKVEHITVVETQREGFVGYK